MGVEDAIMNMDLLNSDFFVFVNPRNREVNVVYRRKDGNLGLLETSTPQQQAAPFVPEQSSESFPV